MPCGGEVREVTEPPWRIVEQQGEVVGLVACTVGVALPAATAQPVTQPVYESVTLAARSGSPHCWAGPRAGAAPSRRRSDEPELSAAWARAFGCCRVVTSTTRKATDARLESQHVPTIDADAGTTHATTRLGREPQEPATRRTRVSLGMLAVGCSAAMTQSFVLETDPGSATLTLRDSHSGGIDLPRAAFTCGDDVARQLQGAGAAPDIWDHL